MLRPMVSATRHDGNGRLLLLLGVVALVAFAGCSGTFLDGDGGEPVDQAPENSNLLVHLDTAVLGDDDTRRLLDGFAEEGTAEDDAEDFVDEFENETGLDVTEASQLLAFAEIPENGVAAEETYGFIVYADWEEDDVVAAFEEEEGTEYRRTEYQGESVLYEPVEEPEFGDAVYLGVLGDGQYVIGDEGAVRGSLDVEYGDADPVSGPVRDVYDDASDGYVTVAVAPPEGSIPESPGVGMQGQIDFQAFQNVQASSVVYDTSDGEAEIEAKMVADDEDEARDIQDVTDGSVSFVRGSIGNDAVTDELRKIEVERDGTTVTVTYRSDIDDVLALLDEY